MNITTAIILAGGLGTRLRPLTDNIPKPLLPVQGKPLIEHIIENLRNHGINKIILSTGYKAEMIKEYFSDGSAFDVKITYCIESEPLGTGGAIRQAAQDLTKPFFVVWGDNLMNLDYQKMVKNHTALINPTPITMVLTPREDVEHFGVAKLENHKIIKFVEKPSREDAPSNLINAGAFIIDPECLLMLPDGKSNIERDCFEKLAPLGKISAYIHEGQWFPTDTIEKYTRAKEEFKPAVIISLRNLQ
jgi:mannose-1-phosphate guanylyltransferase